MNLRVCRLEGASSLPIRFCSEKKAGRPARIVIQAPYHRRDRLVVAVERTLAGPHALGDVLEPVHQAAQRGIRRDDRQHGARLLQLVGRLAQVGQRQEHQARLGEERAAVGLHHRFEQVRMVLQLFVQARRRVVGELRRLAVDDDDHRIGLAREGLVVGDLVLAPRHGRVDEIIRVGVDGGMAGVGIGIGEARDHVPAAGDRQRRRSRARTSQRRPGAGS